MSSFAFFEGLHISAYSYSLFMIAVFHIFWSFSSPGTDDILDFSIVSVALATLSPVVGLYVCDILSLMVSMSSCFESVFQFELEFDLLLSSFVWYLQLVAS